MKNKVLTIALIFAIALSTVGAVSAASGLNIANVETFIFGGGGENVTLGGTTNFDYLDTTDGYGVDGTTVIDTSGNIDAPITSTTGTFSSTLAVTGASTFTGAVDASKFTQGGTVTSSSTAVSDTVPISWLTLSSLILYTPSATTTLTFPATSTMTAFIPTAGDTAISYITNESSVGGTPVTIAAGTGTDLREPENGDVVIENGNQAKLTFIRRTTGGNIIMLVEENIAGD